MPGSDDETTDVIVVGAGFAGIYALYQLRELGFRVRGLEAGSGPGGTWYWNRYPGARCDVRSLAYSYSFSEELEQEWHWTEQYASQAEIERYINHVVDRFDLRRLITFNTRVTAAEYDEEAHRWTVVADSGETLTARYLILALGGYSLPVRPTIDGMDDFQGELYFTAQWPSEPVDFTGKRVGVIGSGSSGMQVVTAVSKLPVEHVYMFQRTPNYAVPSHNAPMDPDYEREFKKNYREYRRIQRDGSPSGGPVEGPTGPVRDLSEEEFRTRMAEAWEIGGTSVYSGVTDAYVDEKANARLAEYLRERVRARIDDPDVAELLCADHFVGARRLLIESGYFESFNLPHVSLVNAKKNPIRRMTPRGLETVADSYDLDMIICATGFDSATGSFQAVGARGRSGRTLSDHWSQGLRTYLGIMTVGFPNLFMIAGPGSPGIRSHVMVCIEQHVEWISAFLSHARSIGAQAIEATTEAEEAWTIHVAETVDKTLLARDDTQYLGANVPGKPRVYTSYVGGTPRYRRICDQIADSGYEGFEFVADGRTHTASREWSGPPVEDIVESTASRATVL